MNADESTNNFDISFITIIGLVIALGGPIVSTLIITPTIEAPLGQEGASWIGLLLIWLCVASVLAIVWREKQPLSSIGFGSITRREAGIAIVIGLILSIGVPILTILFATVLNLDSDTLESTASFSPLLVVAGVLTAAIAEEVLFRGYPIERLNGWMGSIWPGTALATICFIIAHISTWNIAHILAVVSPYGIILALLYVWKRNLLFVMIVHFMIDLPLIFIALSSQ